MRRNHENIKEFNNGNINFRFTPEQIAELKTGKVSAIEVISWILDEIDCYFIGESYCLSNYTSGATIYNAYSDLCYKTVTSSRIDTTALKRNAPDIAEKYTKTTETKRFTFA